MAAGSKEMRNPATCLTDDLIVEILSRLPVKSVCRFKCVSKHWRGLISHPGHRKKLPQTLAGFFYHTFSRVRLPETARHFTNFTGSGAPLIRPSLSFLPGHADVTLLDSCNGLLCRSPTAAGAYRYVVCNPATEQWVALPESSEAGDICEARVVFDPAVGSQGEWAHRDSGWSAEATLWDGMEMNTVFLNGFLHVFAFRYKYVLVVDTKGNSWRTIPVPHGIGGGGFIGHSQGCLYYFSTVREQLSVFVLEDYASDEWILKYSVMISELLGMGIFRPLQNLITIHPECHLIFFVSDLGHTIRCYDMDSRKVRVICSTELGRELDYFSTRCLSYVPLSRSYWLL